MTDPELGSLKWNADLEWWEGTILLPSSHSYKLHVFSRDHPDRAIAPAAREAIRRIPTIENRVRAYAAEELLQTYNYTWSDGQHLTSEEFARRLKPDSIEVHEDGYSEFHFGDDGLFVGHGVGVRIDDGGEFQEAVVEG